MKPADWMVILIIMAFATLAAIGSGQDHRRPVSSVACGTPQ